MAVAKALGNGVPIGACLASGAAAQLIQPGSHGTTFGGNPLSCRAGLTVIEQMTENDLVARAGALGNTIMEKLKSNFENTPGVVSIRGKGLMIGVELNAACGAIATMAAESGLLLTVTADRVVRILPPYIMSDEEADMLVDKLSTVIKQFLAQQEAPKAQQVTPDTA